MQAQLNSDTAGLVGRPVQSIEVGECCLARQEETWHRAAVTAKPGEGKVEVQLVDLGSILTLPLASIASGDFALYDTEPLAIRCRLDTKLVDLNNLVERQEGKLTLRIKSFKDNCFTVNLDKEKGEQQQGREEDSAADPERAAVKYQPTVGVSISEMVSKNSF